MHYSMTRTNRHIELYPAGISEDIHVCLPLLKAKWFIGLNIEDKETTEDYGGLHFQQYGG